jgi:polar amino acid transport system substrate-binding protein
LLRTGALRLAVLTVLTVVLQAAHPSIAATNDFAPSGVIRFAGDFTSAPALYFDERHEARGSDYEICNAVAARLGVKAAWVNLPFGSLIPALSAGRADATCSAMFITPERSRVVAFVPYRFSGHGAAVVKGNPRNVRELADICGLAAVEVLGTVYEKTIKKQSAACVAAGKPPVDLKTFATAADVADQFADGRADVWLAGDTILDYYMRKRPGVLENAFSRKDLTFLGIGIDPRNIALGKAFSAALIAMKADGSYQAILVKYGIPQEQVNAFNVRPVTAER